MGGWPGGTTETTVRRNATAGFRGMGSGRPTLPIVLGACHFDEDCFDNDCMPVLDMVPDNAEHSVWTGFLGSASQSTIGSDHFPSQCGGTGIGDVKIAVGDAITLANGAMTPLLKAVECMVQTTGIERFVIPIDECATSFGSHPLPVQGFATVEIDSVVTNGPMAGIYLRGIFVATNPGASGGGGNYGTGSIALID